MVVRTEGKIVLSNNQTSVPIFVGFVRLSMLVWIKTNNKIRLLSIKTGAGMVYAQLILGSSRLSPLSERRKYVSVYETKTSRWFSPHSLSLICLLTPDRLLYDRVYYFHEPYLDLSRSILRIYTEFREPQCLSDRYGHEYGRRHHTRR